MTGLSTAQKRHAHNALKALERARLELQKATIGEPHNATWSTFVSYSERVGEVISSDGGECGLRAWLKAEAVADG
jgi:hypothetical protein